MGGGGRSAFTAGCLGGGERDDCMRYWQSPGWTAMTILMVTVWQKKGWTREKEKGNLLMGLFFHAVLICYFFVSLF